MNKKAIISVVVLVVVLIIGAAYLPAHPLTEDDQAKEADMVKGVVTDFGQKLQMVSLLAPQESVRQSMEVNYSAYVAPELLSVWENDPASAPGRLTSSPWPARIEVTSAVKNPDGSYTVSGHVIEVTSKEAVNGESAATYPITLRVENRDNSWIITQFDKGAYEDQSNSPGAGDQSSVPVNVALAGQYVCLSHRDTSGPQTMECAIGLEADNGDSYALDLSAVPENDAYTTQSGQRIKIEGLLVPIDNINSDMWQKYAIKGIIKVNSITKI